ncbi:MAG TPA: ribonuclease P protein component [Caldimonas sp.]|jgi:ribonuclease P protein component|nr:ribonuclease P protein component [Caldimonas sp.]HEX2540773.1 ribonuclease P protein component [Caldimonas sp.]
MARLVRSVDFERVLRVRSRATTAHFAVHHLAALPSAPARARRIRSAPDLSTSQGIRGASPVDDCASEAPQPDGQWLGAVVPKRHARRAVTRSLIKRQIYAAAERHRTELAAGLWVVRLRAPFDRQRFPSAASAALKLGSRTELDALFGAVARPSTESST